MANELQKRTGHRYGLLDTLRGLTLISMIVYHGTWDLVYLYGNSLREIDGFMLFSKWYMYDKGSYIWQQSICWTFILLSGFCWSLGKRHLRRGLLVFGGGAVVSAVTMLFLWEDRVVFGVLTCIGTCMLLMIPLDKWARTWNPWAGLSGSMFLFILTKNINRGCLGFEGLNLIEFSQRIQKVLYRGLFETFLGFTDPEFFSTDYFSLLPWMFLFLVGYFLYQVMKKYKWFEQEPMQVVLQFQIPPVSFLGRHSLIIYMLHQPILYGIFQLVLG